MTTTMDRVRRGVINRALPVSGFLVSLSIALLALPRPASATSIGCTRTTSPSARLICRTPVLSALDARLERMYEQKRAALSPAGAKLLQRSERSWFRFVETVCPMKPPYKSDDRTVPATCLETQYKERLTELAQVARKIGPFRFNRIDMFAAEPHDSSDQFGSVTELFVQHIAWPQIDSPASAAVTRWNKSYNKGDASSDTSSCNDGMGDMTTDYEIGYVNKHVTSIQWTRSEYCHGTPHGFWNIRTSNAVLDQNSRPLTPADVFAAGWETKLQALFWNKLSAKGWAPPENQRNDVENDIKAEVIKPDRWFFTKDGLSVSFDAYEGGCYICNPGTPVITWDDLKPLMAPGSLLP